jgi:hypothetical protein
MRTKENQNKTKIYVFFARARPSLRLKAQIGAGSL